MYLTFEAKVGVASSLDFPRPPLSQHKLNLPDHPKIEPTTRGWEQCVLNVHKETNNLILQISITDIVSHDLSGQNDVFFRCVQNGNVIKESEVIVGNYLSFKPFEVTVVDLNEKDLIITAYDKDFIGKDEIGHYSVDVSTLIGRGVVRGVLR